MSVWGLLLFNFWILTGGVPIDYLALDSLRRNHPAWRLLSADHAPLVVSFLHQVYILPNVRTLSLTEIASLLDDTLYALREILGNELFPKEARDYIEDWASDERGWLRKYYPLESDEPHLDLTPATEKAIEWVLSLEQRQFVGTESRLLTIFELLHQITDGSETDPEVRIRELERKKSQLDAEIDRIRAGHVTLMDETALRERFLQVDGIARGLLSDFREVEQNFRNLDREVRERIATWEGGKGALLHEIFGERDAISDSDQGKSFRAFWDFLMSPSRQEELSSLLEAAFSLEAVKMLRPDRRLLRIHYDWLEAGDVAQKTVARLSEQFRRFLDDQAWLENRRIMEIIRHVEKKAILVRGNPPDKDFMVLSEPSCEIVLPMDRPLYRPAVRPQFPDRILASGEEAIPSELLFEQIYVDKGKLARRISNALASHRSVSLSEIFEAHPLTQGLAEIVVYLSLASENPKTVIDEERSWPVVWTDPEGVVRKATLPEILFFRQ
ncbi:MAG: DUF3375 domain-containing protein [Leptospirillum sp.]